MTPIKIGLILSIFVLTSVEGGSHIRNLANRTGHQNRGRAIRSESKRYDQQMKEAKQLDQKAKKNQEQGLHDLANQNTKEKAEIERKAELNRNNLAVLSKKHPSKITRTPSGRQQIVPAITTKAK